MFALVPIISKCTTQPIQDSIYLQYFGKYIDTLQIHQPPRGENKKHPICTVKDTLYTEIYSV
jgi:hypothetical protein